MTLVAKAIDGREIDVSLDLFASPAEVRMGDYTFTLLQFSQIATHILVGGMFGWGEGNSTPNEVTAALRELNDVYEPQVSGWRRRSLKELVKNKEDQ